MFDPFDTPRDKSLGFHWKAKDNQWIECLYLPLPKSKSYERARASMILDACKEGVGENRAISYSRNKNFYTGQKRYQGEDYSFANVPMVVDELEGLGLFEHNKVKPSSNNVMQSTFRATPLLLEKVNITALRFEPTESVLLRDASKKLIEYRETANTSSMRKNIRIFNEAIQNTDIGIDFDGVVFDGDLGICQSEDGNNVYLNLHRTSLYRVFNKEKWNLGGRFYGGWWQGVPSAHRIHLSLNGYPTVEEDYPELHPRLLYHLEGIPIPDEIYEFDGWERKLGKLAFNILLNADTYQKAVGAISNEIIMFSGPENARARAIELVDAVKARHKAIAHHFHTGIGRNLQFIDSQMAEKIMLKLLKRGVVALPVHDSFIVKDSDSPLLREEMGRVFTRIIQQKNIL
jgi:hypothetical protein